MEKVKQTGFLFKSDPRDYLAGASPLLWEKIQDNADWLQFKPDDEKQYKSWSGMYFDTMSCFPYDTEVLMEDLTYKRICEIRKGEYVISHTGKKRKVLNTMKRDYNKEMYKIKVKGIYEEILCTPEHPFLTEKGWIKAKDLNEDLRVCIPTTSELKKDATIYEVEKNPDFLWLFGLYLAEGSIGKEDNKEYIYPKKAVNGNGGGRGIITFTLHEDEVDFAERIVKIGKELFNIDFNIYTKKDNKAINVCGYSLFLRDLLFDLGGTGSATKKINTRLMFLEPKLQLNIIKGWLDGDGYYNANRQVEGVSISKNLIYDIYRILLRNKIKSNLYKKEAYDIHKEAYIIKIYGEEINKLEIFNLNYENTKPAIYQESRAKIKIDENFLYQKISTIERIEKPLQKNSKNYIKNVYNIEVEKDNSYIVNNVAVHNCTTFSALSSLETYFNKLLKENKLSPETVKILKDNGYITNNKFNFSDRFTAIMSGTMRQGNYFQNVWDSIRKDGLIPEADFPFGGNNWDEYHDKSKITNAMLTKASMFASLFDINYEFVGTDDTMLFSSLKYSPVQVACPIPGTHAMELINVNNFYDTYEPFVKQRNSPINYALRFMVKPKGKKTVTITRNKSTLKETTGTLITNVNGVSFSCTTLELPDLNNAKNISCIPKGEYTCKWTFSPRFMKYTYEVMKVPNRTGIRLHSANFFSELNGCIALGAKLSDINGDKELDTTNSRATIKSFEALFNKEDFTLIIK